MAKHARKRQKTSKSAKEKYVLGSNPLTGDASKDEEERRLESILFGTKFVPREEGALVIVEDGQDGEVEGGGQEMNNLLDTDVGSSGHLLFNAHLCDQVILRR